MKFMERCCLTVTLAFFVLIAFWGCSRSEKDGRQTVTQPVEVRVSRVIRGDIHTEIHATGTILPDHETYIGPRISGRVEKLFVDEGDFVKKGSPLVKLEQSHFRLALKEAEASCREMQAQLKNLDDKLKRNKRLYEKGIIDKNTLNDVRTKRDLANARLEIARARLEMAEKDMKDSVLYAPFSGFVVERKINTGEIYSAMPGEYVYHIVDTASVKVEVNISETKKRFVHIGKQASVAVDAFPGRVFKGRITVVNPFVDSSNRKFLVKIKIKNPEFLLESGMFARVSIPERKSLNTLIVPAEAVVHRNGRAAVFAVRDSKACLCPVVIGIRTHELVEVVKGIKESDEVITDGLYAVRDGTDVVFKKD